MEFQDYSHIKGNKRFKLRVIREVNRQNNNNHQKKNLIINDENASE